jgi:hypothetical protein
VSINVITRRSTGQWRPPNYQHPLALDAKQVKRLGDRDGKTWYAWTSEAFGPVEMQETGDPLDPSWQIIPNGPVLKTVRDDRLLYQAFQLHEPGTFEALKNAVEEMKPPAPQKAIDLLNRYDPLLTKQGAYALRGAPAIVERLRRRGIEAHLSADRSRLVATAAGGRLFWQHSDAVLALEPLLVPFLRDGRPPPCEVSKHPKPVDAVTIAAPGDVAWCGACEPS